MLRLEERDVPEPGPGAVRITVASAGLNPVDWQIVESSDVAKEFGISLPSGFGNDFSGIIDAVSPGVTTWRHGDRVFGGARGEAVAEHIIAEADDPHIHPTPDGLDNETASVLYIAGRTASAVIDALAPQPGDTLLVGAAAGGVGTFVTQLAVLAGARVIGTGSLASHDYLRSLGAEPVLYGEGLGERVRNLAPAGITTAADLFGTDTARTALGLGVPTGRVVTIEAPHPPEGARGVNGSDAGPDALRKLIDHIVAGRVRVPIAAVFDLADFRTAVELQRSRHVHGKISIRIGS